jgi:hypothetical protein
MSEHLKNIFDWASIGTAISTLMGWMPSIAAMLSAIWALIRIYETDTVQKRFGKKK